MYMDDINLFAKNEKEQETLIRTSMIYSQDIGMNFDIEKWAMLCRKKETTQRTTKSGKNQITLRERILEVYKIGLVLSFNGLSIFLGYLMPNPSFSKNSSGTI